MYGDMRWKSFKTKLLIFLIMGISGISLGFLLLSCGAGPATKVGITNKGAYAVDFSESPPLTGFIGMGNSLGAEVDIDNFEFTVEAWIKSVTTTLSGGIFSRARDEYGLLLFSYQNDARFAVKRDGSDPYILESGYTGMYTSLVAVGGTFDWHHSYYDKTNKDLRYAWLTSGTLNSIIVDSTGDVGQHTSIAIDGAGDLHISYYDVTNTALKHATCVDADDCTVAANWSTETVDNTASVGKYSSIATDGANNVHISYYDETNTALKYATGTTDSFTTETVNASGDVGKYNSIAVESGGTVHISYFIDDSADDLMYITGTADNWGTPVQVDSTGDVGRYTSIALDTSNYVHISYYDAENTALKHATGTGSAFTPETVDSTASVGQYSSIAIDSAGNGENVHISYYDATNTAIKYTNNYGGWAGNIRTLNSTEDVGKYTSISVDTTIIPDRIWVAYLDYTNGNLRRSRINSPLSSPSVGDWTTDVGYSLVQNTWVHIAAVLTIQPNTLADSNCTNVGAETPHIEIYVDAELVNCASTGSNYAQGARNEMIGRSQVRDAASEWTDIKISGAYKLEAVIDEVRFWKGPRTAAEIQECMSQELVVGTGACGMNHPDLIGYWRLNEGSGRTITDYSGSGNTGTKNYCPTPVGEESCGVTPLPVDQPWEEGWTTGYPFP